MEDYIMDGVQATGPLQQPFQEGSEEIQSFKPYLLHDLLLYMHQLGETPPDLSLRNVTVERTKKAEIQLLTDYVAFLTENLPSENSQEIEQLKALDITKKIVGSVDLIILKQSVNEIYKQLFAILKNVFPDVRNNLDSMFLNTVTKDIMKKPSEHFSKIVSLIQLLPAIAQKQLSTVLVRDALDNGNAAKAMELIPQIERSNKNDEKMLDFIQTLTEKGYEKWAVAYAEELSDQNFKKDIYEAICSGLIERGEHQKAETYIPKLGDYNDKIVRHIADRYIDENETGKALKLANLLDPNQVKTNYLYLRIIAQLVENRDWENALTNSVKLTDRNEQASALKKIAKGLFIAGEYDRAMNVIDLLGEEKRDKLRYEFAEKSLEQDDPETGIKFAKRITDPAYQDNWQRKLAAYLQKEKLA